MRQYLLGLSIALTFAPAATGCAETVMEAEPMKPTPGRSANGGAQGAEAAVAREFEDALRAGMPAALELFIARHPDHALAKDARDGLFALELGEPCAASESPTK